jgi:hypothetical protein
MYAKALTAMGGGGGIGAPPSVPELQPHIGAPPYDVAKDPAWQGIVAPDDHPLRNFLNGLSPEERQMLLERLAKGKAGGMGQPPGGAAPMPQAAAPMPAGPTAPITGI